jgi:hypothetical protein
MGNAMRVMQIATGEAEETRDENGKDKAAADLGRRGGKARAEWSRSTPSGTTGFAPTSRFGSRRPWLRT